MERLESPILPKIVNLEVRHWELWLHLSYKLNCLQKSLLNSTWVREGRREIKNFESFIQHLRESRDYVHTSPPIKNTKVQGALQHDRLIHHIQPLCHLECPHGDLLTFWRKPSPADERYVSPYNAVGPPVKYVTFEPDVGGWNNIRMQMETILVFAMATGRSLVLPPDQPLYLLNKGKGHENAHSFADFFPFEHINHRVPILTMEQYMAREAVAGRLRINGTISYPPRNKTEFIGTDEVDRMPCGNIFEKHPPARPGKHERIPCDSTRSWY